MNKRRIPSFTNPSPGQYQRGESPSCSASIYAEGFFKSPLYKVSSSPFSLIIVKVLPITNLESLLLLSSTTSPKNESPHIKRFRPSFKSIDIAPSPPVTPLPSPGINRVHHIESSSTPICVTDDLLLFWQDTNNVQANK